ncbi:hypothetical protein [Bacillus sp. FJAT-27225]|uniref:hypothetical protein n=1 Tax=Bacillus sp. FJAT-27225 TaxID=1743144 RepID=UPI00158600F4|nr:hypothetical protein [Bacillus sp. FJAT-27225]
MTYQNKIESILGVDIRVRSRCFVEDVSEHDPFKRPIIHKKINGQVISPLDLERLWS